MSIFVLLVDLEVEEGKPTSSGRDRPKVFLRMEGGGRGKPTLAAEERTSSQNKDSIKG